MRCLPAGDRVLLFSQFAGMGGHTATTRAGDPRPGKTPFLHGGVYSENSADRMVQRFQGDPDGPAGIRAVAQGPGAPASTCPGPTTSSTTTRWWNPAVENQATDRAFHIGPDQGRSRPQADLRRHAGGPHRPDDRDQAGNRRPGGGSHLGKGGSRNCPNAELRDVLALSATPVD